MASVLSCGRSVAFVPVVLLALASEPLASPYDLPCEIGPWSYQGGTLTAGPNGPRDPAREDAAMAAYRGELQSRTRFLDTDRGLLALNPADGYSHNHRWHAGLWFTRYEFDERDGVDIPEIRVNVATLDVGVQIGQRYEEGEYRPKRGTRIGVRLPYVDYLDRDPAGPFDESGLFDPQVYADVGIPIDRNDNPFLTGLLLQTWATLPTGDEDEALGRGDATIGVVPRWFMRWTPDEPSGSGPRLTQFELSAGLGYAWDLESSENSYWSPAVGLWLAWADRVFLQLELQGRLHDSGVDQVDASVVASFRLLPEDRRNQVFLSVGARSGLGDDGLRDDFAPVVGVTFAFGQVP